MSETTPETTAVRAENPNVAAPAINADTPVTPPPVGDTTTVAEATTDTGDDSDGDGPGDTEDDDPPGDH